MTLWTGQTRIFLKKKKREEEDMCVYVNVTENMKTVRPATSALNSIYLEITIPHGNVCECVHQLNAHQFVAVVCYCLHWGILHKCISLFLSLFLPCHSWHPFFHTHLIATLSFYFISFEMITCAFDYAFDVTMSTNEYIEDKSSSTSIETSVKDHQPLATSTNFKINSLLHSIKSCIQNATQKKIGSISSFVLGCVMCVFYHPFILFQFNSFTFESVNLQRNRGVQA